jgi:serine phosphatase RsbU (regulator of sigma subunit)
MRGSPLGTKEEAAFGHLRLQLDPGSLLMAFTDGCLEGSRSVKRLKQTLEAKFQDNLDFGAISKAIIETGMDSVLVDDKTMVLLRHEALDVQKTA